MCSALKPEREEVGAGSHQARLQPFAPRCWPPPSPATSPGRGAEASPVTPFPPPPQAQAQRQGLACEAPSSAGGSILPPRPRGLLLYLRVSSIFIIPLSPLSSFQLTFFFILIFFLVLAVLGLVAVRRLSLVGATLRCGARASHCSGFSSCGARALGARASVAVALGL